MWFSFASFSFNSFFVDTEDKLKEYEKKLKAFNSFFVDTYGIVSYYALDVRHLSIHSLLILCLHEEGGNDHIR